MLQKKLNRGIRDDRLSLVGIDEILDILRDGRHAEIVLPGPFDQSLHEEGTILVPHDVPSLVDDEESLLIGAPDGIPDIIQYDVHRHRTQGLIEVADREYHQSLLEIDIRPVREDSGEDSSDVGLEPFCDPFRAVHGLQHGEKLLHDGYFLSLYIIILEGNSLQAIGHDDSLFKDGGFARSELSEHEIHETDQIDDRIPQEIPRTVHDILERTWKIEWVDPLL